MGTRLLNIEGSRILMMGFDIMQSNLIELRAEVQLDRGKVSAPAKRLELDPAPSDQELSSGLKSVVTVGLVLNGTGFDRVELHAHKAPTHPVLILRGVIEHRQNQ